MNEEPLISLVEGYPELYKHEDPRYHDDQRQLNIWEVIAGILNETSIACKDKWKKIRENFRKATNLRKTKSGQAAKNFKPIRYSKELSFLTSYIHSESKSLTNMPSITSDDEQSNLTTPPSIPGSPAVSVATTISAKSDFKRKRTEEAPRSVQSLFQSYIDKKYAHNRQEEDPVVNFFTNLGQTVKQFPPDLRLSVKKKVFNIVSEAEEEVIRRNDTVQSAEVVDQLTLSNTLFSQNAIAHPAGVIINSSSQLPSTHTSQTNVHTRFITSQDIATAPIFLSTSQTSTPQNGSHENQLEEFISFPRK